LVAEIETTFLTTRDPTRDARRAIGSFEGA
jgi:hypothetical protein